MGYGCGYSVARFQYERGHELLYRKHNDITVMCDHLAYSPYKFIRDLTSSDDMMSAVTNLQLLSKDKYGWIQFKQRNTKLFLPATQCI